MGQFLKNVFIVVACLAVMLFIEQSIKQGKGTYMDLHKLPQILPQWQKPIAESRPNKSDCREGLIYNLTKTGLDKIQEERKSTVKQVCNMCKRKRSSSECNHISLEEDNHLPEMYDNLIVDVKHKVILCVIQKSGSTIWTNSLWRSVSNVPIMHRAFDPLVYSKVGLKPLSWFSNNERKLLLKTYFKFLVVRYPFERLVSCYRSKLEHSNRKTETNLQILLRENNITLNTFNKFISYVKTFDDEHQKNVSMGIATRGLKYFNRHWAQYSTLCHPCHTDYDYIVKFETMREDAAYVLSKLGPHDKCPKVKYPDLFRKSEPSSLKVYKKYLAQLTTVQIKKLREIYSIDFKLFGY